MLLFQLLQSDFRIVKPKAGFLIRKICIMMLFTRRVAGIYKRVMAQRSKTSHCRFETMSFFDSTKYLYPNSFCCVINDLRAADRLRGHREPLAEPKPSCNLLPLGEETPPLQRTEHQWSYHHLLRPQTAPSSASPLAVRTQGNRRRRTSHQVGRRVFQRTNSIFRVSNWSPTCRRYRYKPLANAAPVSSRPSHNTW